MNLDQLNQVLGLLNTVMGMMPKVSLYYFAAAIAAGWALLILAGVVYINLLHGENDYVISRMLNTFWVYMAGATVAFVLTRGSVLNAIAWWLGSMIVFEMLFMQFALAYNKLKANPDMPGWKRYPLLAFLLGVLIVGFPFDVNFNLTWGRMMFWQKPLLIGHGETPWKRISHGDWTLTATLIRNVAAYTWQGSLARFICLKLIHPWDKTHCGKIVLL